MAKKYRRKPIVIEAMEYDGTNDWALSSWAHEGVDPMTNAIIRHNGHGLEVRTLEGPLHISAGDYVIKGVKGEFYPCKPDIFVAIYEPAE